ncbi:MAG: transcriptional repressor [Lachnospiraceae bacterium]|nr:transcriptional repressor [Lachnospiraceae bacterium]
MSTTRLTYRTRQREILLQYLKSMAGNHVTAQDAAEYLKAQGSTIGQSTVYRQLEKLVDEGVVSKYIIDQNTPACFEYIGEDSHEAEEVCFHCKCERCGRLIHMHCDELEGIAAHLLEEHHFRLNPLRTVFYGICEACQKQAAGKQ